MVYGANTQTRRALGLVRGYTANTRDAIDAHHCGVIFRAYPANRSFWLAFAEIKYGEMVVIIR